MIACCCTRNRKIDVKILLITSFLCLHQGFMFKPGKIIIMTFYIDRNRIKYSFSHELIFSDLGSSDQYQSSGSNFIFLFRNKDNLMISLFKSRVYQNRANALYTDPSIRPTFGGRHDIKIPYNAKNSQCYSNFGHTYLPSSGYTYGNTKTKQLLAGSYRFKPSEIEVYYLP